MAYNDDGQWIGFHPEFDEEDREALNNVDRSEQAKQYRQAQQNSVSYQQTINDATTSALKELDIPPEEWAAMNQALPVEAQRRAIARGTKKYVRKLAAAAKRKTQGQPGQRAASGRQPRSKPAPETLTNAREKVETGGHLSHNEEMDILAAVLGPDFKV